MLKRTRQLKFCATLCVSAIDYKCQRHGVEVRSWANCKYRIQEQKLTAHEDWGRGGAWSTMQPQKEMRFGYT